MHEIHAITRAYRLMEQAENLTESYRDANHTRHEIGKNFRTFGILPRNERDDRLKVQYTREDAKVYAYQDGIHALADILNVTMKDIFSIARIARKYMESTNYQNCFHGESAMRLTSYYCGGVDDYGTFHHPKNAAEPTERQNALEWAIAQNKRRREA